MAPGSTKGGPNEQATLKGHRTGALLSQPLCWDFMFQSSLGTWVGGAEVICQMKKERERERRKGEGKGKREGTSQPDQPETPSLPPLATASECFRECPWLCPFNSMGLQAKAAEDGGNCTGKAFGGGEASEGRDRATLGQIFRVTVWGPPPPPPLPLSS